MKKYFVFACFVFTAIGSACGQPTFLYKTDGAHGKYVLVLPRGYFGGVSDVIMSDSFAVGRDDSFYMLTFTNAVRFHAEINVVSSPSVRTNFVQATISFPVMQIGFPTNTQVLFDGAVTDFGHIQSGRAGSTNVK